MRTAGWLMALPFVVAGCDLRGGQIGLVGPAPLPGPPAPLVGTPAPPFALLDQEDRPVTPGKLHGRWVVLYFFPPDDAPACACQANQFTAMLKRFGDMDAAVLGINGEASAMHRYLIAKYGLPMPLLSDPNHAVAQRYGAWRDSPDPGGHVVRSALLVDPAGIIRSHWPNITSTDDLALIRRRIEELRRQR